MLPHILLSFSLALSAAASPLVTARNPVTLPLARRFNFTGAQKITEIDQERVKSLRSYGASHEGGLSKRSIFPVAATNGAVEYTVEVRSSCTSAS